MNLKKIATTAAIAATVATGSAIASAPAQALSLNGGFNFSGNPPSVSGSGSTVTLNFSGSAPFNISGLTGFTGVTGTPVFKPLTVTQTQTPGVYALTAPLSGFITGLSQGGNPFSFDLTSATIVGGFTNVTNYFLAGVLTGNFTSLGSTIATGNAYFGASGNSPLTGRFQATAVPTPALLPSLLGFGVAALRKRKGEAEATEAEAETVGVKA